MGSGTVSKDGDAHLAGTVAPLSLIGDTSIGVHSKDAVTVVVSADIGVKTAWEDVSVAIIAVLATPVMATEPAKVGEHVTIIIKVGQVVY